MRKKGVGGEEVSTLDARVLNSICIFGFGDFRVDSFVFKKKKLGVNFSCLEVLIEDGIVYLNNY